RRHWRARRCRPVRGSRSRPILRTPSLQFPTTGPLAAAPKLHRGQRRIWNYSLPPPQPLRRQGSKVRKSTRSFCQLSSPMLLLRPFRAGRFSLAHHPVQRVLPWPPLASLGRERCKHLIRVGTELRRTHWHVHADTSTHRVEENADSIR